MYKTKILAIAPYQGMAEIMTSIAHERTDIEMTVQIGNLDAGRDIAVKLAHKNYDVILSRGGTAELIRAYVEIPVIDISISVYDVLRAIKLSEHYVGTSVIAGFSGITNCANLLCDLLQYDINIITFSNESETLPLLKAAKDRGCSLVLCDIAGLNAAQKLCMNSILISSGSESIHAAIDEAIKLVQAVQHIYKQRDLFQSLLTESDKEILIFDPADKLWFSSLVIEELHTTLMEFVNSHLEGLSKAPNQRMTKQIRDKIYILQSKHLYHSGQKYTAILIQQKDAIFAEDDMTVTVYHKPQQSLHEIWDYFFSSSNKVGNTAQLIEMYSKTNEPVLVIGETGTGKDRVASILYENGVYNNAPLYIIDCTSINDKKWNRIINHDSSPLNTIRTTIYIKNPAALTVKQWNQLCAYMEHSNLKKRTRLIFSLIEVSHISEHQREIRSYLENRLSCVTLKLSSLSERKDDLPSIIALYIHKMNTVLGKQVIGFEAEAMKLMTSFPWKYNLDQLQHVLKELVVTSTTPYITYKATKQFLSLETSSNVNETEIPLQLTGTLEEINYQIIQLVLQEEHQNKEKTARRLGISRSTLWRILKNNKIE